MHPPLRPHPDGTVAPAMLLKSSELAGIYPECPSTVDAFCLINGARRPSEPCDHCRRLRLQCIILQTTLANPNPVSCCSSCAALFRDCSLANEGKRLPSLFETPQPVIGQLHGIGEEGDLGFAHSAVLGDQDPFKSSHLSGSRKRSS